MPSDFLLGVRLNSTSVLSHRPQGDEPTARPLRIFTTDPSLSRLEGCISIARVPFEPLKPPQGSELLRGKLFSVDIAPRSGRTSPLPSPRAADDAARSFLDQAACLMGQGQQASEADEHFHAQMVYAVASLVHASFRRALGRQIGWNQSGAKPLSLRPLYDEEPNAWYDRQAGQICFGFARGEDGWVFTSLSHDIIAHEVTHALLDGLRSRFAEPTSADVCGFHEGFADLVALLHHYEYESAVHAALARTGGRLRPRAGDPDNPGYNYLCGLAQQFGRRDRSRVLRSALNSTRYAPDLPAHAMGEVLLAAVFEAFERVYERKTAALRRLAGRAGREGGEDLDPDLLELLAHEATKLSRIFLDMLIRAVDYCPPVDLQLGEYLRALITADADLVPEDPLGLREALIDAFRARGVRPQHVLSLSEDSLRWKTPRVELRLERLAFANIRFAGDPDCPLPLKEQREMAEAIGACLASEDYCREFGLLPAGRPGPDGAEVSAPVIESVRTLRRPGPDGRVLFETVVEITQDCLVPARQGRAAFALDGGATLVFSSLGQLRLAISKSARAEGRLERARQYLSGAQGARYWERIGSRLMLKPDFCRALHSPPR